MRKAATPNIVYILADDMGYGDVSCLNRDSKIRTTHLDRLAAGGMIFRDAHSTSAVCSPSRYSILTGRYNWRSRLKSGVLSGWSSHLVEPGRVTVASYLKNHGYHSAMIGKWHLGWDWGTGDGRPADLGEEKNLGWNPETVDYRKPILNGPDACGFDYYYGICGSLDMAPYVYVESGRVTALPDRETEDTNKFTWWRKGPTGSDFRHDDVLPNFTRRSVAYIEERARTGEPFFLYLPLNAPHTPILPSPEFQGKSGTNPYGDFCLHVDDTVGQVMAALDRCGIADNTIVIFTSDNGCSDQADFPQLAALGHHPSYVFRGHKFDIYEGGHRIPLIIRWPQIIAAGSSTDETVCLVDLLATCADIVGEPLPDSAGEDSVSNLPVWEGRPLDRSLREATVHHSVDGSFSIRKGRWKLEMCPGSGGLSHPRPGKECEGLPPIQLYDLSVDIGERKNLQEHHPEVVEELTALLTRYVRDGRSTPGKSQDNTGAPEWEQLWWMLSGSRNRPAVLEGIRRVVFLGDSITQNGNYVADIECWLLAQGLSMPVLSVGLGSEAATTLTGEENADHVEAHGFPRPPVEERLDRVLAMTRPDLLFVCYGMNDSSGLPAGEAGVQRYAAAMTRLRERALADGVKRVVCCTAPIHDAGPGKEGRDPRDEKLAGYRDWLLSRRRDGWDVVDIHGPMRSELEERRITDPSFRFAEDGVHPGREGHWVMAREILQQFFAVDLDGITGAEDFFPREGESVRALVHEKVCLLWAAYMTEIGHTRPGIPGHPDAVSGLPIEQAEAKASAMEKSIRDLLT